MFSFGFIISLRITFKTDGKFYKSYIYIYMYWLKNDKE